MKRAKYALLAVGLLLGLSLVIFSTATAVAGPQDSVRAVKPTSHPGHKPTSQPGHKPPVTPGAKATENALQMQMKGKKVTYQGTVTAVYTSTSSLTLTLADGTALDFAVTADTRIQIPTMGRDATLADIHVGVHALVQAAQQVQAGRSAGPEDTLTALRIVVIPGKPERIHRVGVVTAYTAGVSIAIQDMNGDLFTFALTADTKILPPERASELAVGSRVTIISRRDVTGGPLAAQGIVVHPSGQTEGDVDTK